MKPSHTLATKLGSFGLGTPKASFRPISQRTRNRNITSSHQFVSHTFGLGTPTRASTKLGSSHQHPPRLTAHHISTMSPANFSSGSEGPETEAALAKLLSVGGGRWTLTADGRAIEREFKFKTFTKTWDFMTAVSLQCKIKNHHAEWSNVYNTTFIRWTTHNPQGLSTKDLELASICDSLAQDFGEIIDTSSPPPAPSATTTNAADQALPPSREKLAGLSSLANEAVTAAGGDCGCGPAPKKPAGLVEDRISKLANEAVTAAGWDCECEPAGTTETKEAFRYL
ncbi:pterin 4 alpha carbinolamine dehydratase-domain-containing protein [Rhypophila decipiens]|uniref:4a-hydroxytetrahydrobiopterin dehydratase n=1 Tax=Rhypophila decipiens TaxID=261697 RepID=A0AAN6YKF6_9PEZI|nr:pterin 4 alpha carbinolamine dehydratase-domain-containing protein [Rhypophila decipiens]